MYVERLSGTAAVHSRSVRPMLGEMFSIRKTSILVLKKSCHGLVLGGQRYCVSGACRCRRPWLRSQRSAGCADAAISNSAIMYEIKVQNLSAATARQGAVHVLNSSSPIDINWNASSTCDVSSLTFAALASAVLSSPRQRTYTAEQLATGTSSFISFPTSLSSTMAGANMDLRLMPPAPMRTCMMPGNMPTRANRCRPSWCCFQLWLWTRCMKLVPVCRVARGITLPAPWVASRRTIPKLVTATHWAKLQLLWLLTLLVWLWTWMSDYTRAKPSQMP